MAYRFKQFLDAFGETVNHYPYENGEYGQPSQIKAFISPARVDDTLVEAGYLISDYITVHTNVKVKPRDKILVNETAYEVRYVQPFFWRNEVVYYMATCRRLLAV